MIQWKRVPWPLWVLAAFAVIDTALLEVTVDGPVLPRAVLPFVMFAWFFLLLKRVRWVWLATVAVSILGFVPDAISGSLTWLGVVSGLIGLLLLLLPVTRRYFSSSSVVGAEA